MSTMTPRMAKMWLEAQKAEGEQREFLFAYLDGLLMHFSLDRIVHPYVFIVQVLMKTANTREFISITTVSLKH